MKKLSLIAVVFAGMALGAWYLLHENGPQSFEGESIEVHCAAGLRKPVEEIAAQFEKEYGVRVNLSYGGSGELFGKLEMAGGDLYIPADVSYTNKAKQKGLVNETIEFAHLTAGIMVKEGNPMEIRDLQDLQRKDVRVVLAEKSAAVGRFTHKVLDEAGVLEAIEEGTFSTTPTVNAVANQVKLNSADAGIVWDSIVAQYPGHTFIHVEEFDRARKTSTVGVLESAKNPQLALRFARYLTARDKGLKIFSKYGFDVLPGDLWEEEPKVVLFSGSMLRPAIQEQLARFQEREGCLIHVKYLGCGELVSIMDGGETPEAFFSCDTAYLEKVQDRFEEGVTVSANEIVLLVAKGNPKKVESLDDLSRKGLKVGLADKDKSALGGLTYAMLEREGLLNRIKQSGTIQVLVAKGDDLVNQMQVGALDAALLYRSNALASPRIMQHCEMIGLNTPYAIAHQPYAVAKHCTHPQLMNRLGAFLTNDKGKASFLEFGFQWVLVENSGK